MKHHITIACLCLLSLISGICMAGTGQAAHLKGASTDGQTHISVTIDPDDASILSAILITGSDSLMLSRTCDAYTVIDLPNHLLTITFQQRGIATGDPEGMSVVIWATPSSFVKLPGSDMGWRFSAKIKQRGHGIPQVEATKLECTVN